MVGLSGAALLSWTFVELKRNQLEVLAGSQARSAANDLQRTFQAATQGFAAIAKRNAAALHAGGPFHLQMTGLKAAAWAEPSGKVVRVDPPDEKQGLADADLSGRDADRLALAKARESGQPAVTRPIRLPEGDLGFHLIVPGMDGDRVVGFLVAVFSEQELGLALLQKDLAAGWAFGVFDDAQELYRRGSPDGGRWMAASTFEFFDARRHIRASPGPQVVAELEGPLPAVALATGSLISLLLAGAAVLAQAAGRRAREAEAANDALRNSEKRKGAMLEASLDAVVMMDHRGDVVEFNAAAEALFGYSRAQAVGRPLADLLIPQRLRDRHRQGLESYLATGNGPVIGRRIELPAIRFDGSEFPVEIGIIAVHSDVPLFMGFIRDLSEQKRAVEARSRLAAIVDSSHDAIIGHTLDGLITSWNKGAERVFGYAAEDVIGKPVAMLVPPGCIGEEPHAVEQLKKGEAIDHILTQGRRKDGQDVDVSMTISPIQNSSGEVVGVSRIARDISQEKRIEELRIRSVELEARSRQIQEANRLKSEFLANMSHELRTPLNAVIGFSELMYDGKVGPASDAQRDCLEDILTSSRHLLQLINDVLDLAKIEAGKMEFRPEPVDVARVIGEVGAILRSLSAKKRIEVHADIEAGLSGIVTDPGKLKQVLYNYLSNAIKFTPEGGRVSVQARGEGADRFRIEVEDSGIGIGEKDLALLFTEFQQIDSSTSKTHAGTGLGLALTRRIVEAQGGRVGVHSALGKGSVFFAVLPRLAGASATNGAEPEGRVPRPAEQTILVVEDDNDERRWLVDTLAKAGYGVEVARTGHEAVLRCRERRFDAITLDLLLPDTVGWEVLREVRAAGRNQVTPAIVVTVVAEKDAGSAFAIHDYITKPVRAEQLLASLERAGVLPTDTRPILIVDDDPQARRLMDATLQSVGYRVLPAASGEEGLNVAAAHAPAAVVLDLLMPSMDGFEFLERFRRTAAGLVTPVIVWTAKDVTAQDHSRLAASLAHAVVAKGEGSARSLIEELRSCIMPPASGGRV